jgi:hypothetical protein
MRGVRFEFQTGWPPGLIWYDIEQGPGAGPPDVDNQGDFAMRQTWPECPQCSALRTTRCPICGHEGTDCAQADPEFVGVVDSDEEGKPMACSCGSGGCSGGRAESPAEERPDGAERAEQAELAAESPPLMLLCPTCDDPFVPEYARRCASCGHEFAEGYESAPEIRLDERLSARAVAVLLGLVAVLIAMVLYFALVL